MVENRDNKIDLLDEELSDDDEFIDEDEYVDSDSLDADSRYKLPQRDSFDDEEEDEIPDSDSIDIDSKYTRSTPSKPRFNFSRRAQEYDEEEEDTYDSDYIDVDKGLTLPNIEDDFDEEDDDEDDYYYEEEVEVPKTRVTSTPKVKEVEIPKVKVDTTSKSLKQEAKIETSEKPIIRKVEIPKVEETPLQKIEIKEETPIYKDYFGENKEKASPSFIPFKESFSSPKKEPQKESFKPFVEKVGEVKPSTPSFKPFKENISSSPSPSYTVRSTGDDLGFASSKKESPSSNESFAQVLDENKNPVNINSISNSQLSDMFKKKMLEIIFGSSKEEKTIDRIDEDDNPDINLGGEDEIGKGKKKIKFIENTNVQYSADSIGTPKCLPKGFRNTKYSKKTRGLMKVDFTSWFFFICFLLVGGTAYSAYALYNFAFVPYLSMLELPWLNIFTFMIVPFGIGLFASIIINDLLKHIIAFYSGYRVLTFRMFGFTFYHYGSKTRKVSFSLRNIFCFRHEYIPYSNKISRNPFPIYLLSGLGQLGFFGYLWVRYVSFMNATDSRFVFWSDQPQTVFLWMTFYTFIYALIPFIYNYIPIKTRILNDAYTLFQIRGKNDRTCFNICAINQKREITGEDFVLAPISCNIQNYFQHYAYYYTYLARLYNEDYKNARKDLHYLRQLTSVISKKDRHIVDFERSYIRYLYSDPADAEVIYAKVKKGAKKARKPRRLSDYRICIELCANILQDSKRIIYFVEKLNSFLPYYPAPGKRILKEYQFITYNLKHVQEVIPNIRLPELTPLQFSRK